MPAPAPAVDLDTDDEAPHLKKRAAPSGGVDGSADGPAPRRRRLLSDSSDGDSPRKKARADSEGSETGLSDDLSDAAPAPDETQAFSAPEPAETQAAGGAAADGSETDLSE